MNNIKYNTVNACSKCSSRLIDIKYVNGMRVDVKCSKCDGYIDKHGNRYWTVKKIFISPIHATETRSSRYAELPERMQSTAINPVRTTAIKSLWRDWVSPRVILSETDNEMFSKAVTDHIYKNLSNRVYEDAMKALINIRVESPTVAFTEIIQQCVTQSRKNQDKPVRIKPCSIASKLGMTKQSFSKNKSGPTPLLRLIQSIDHMIKSWEERTA